MENSISMQLQNRTKQNKKTNGIKSPILPTTEEKNNNLKMKQVKQVIK